MEPVETIQNLFNEKSILKESYDYVVDTAQRSVLFWDVLRQRGNGYLDHLAEGQPPVLIFDYEIIVDGRILERPANYALAEIIDKRCKEEGKKGGEERRKAPGMKPTGVEAKKRPIVIIDPRAGHGPGIGGSKQDSEIGMALCEGHPVYFVLFFTEPMPGQTLADVKNAEVIFLEEVKKRHPHAPEPAVIGNCQGGWGASLVGADRPDLVGPLMLSGSPLSYWSGMDGNNPMRYTGGLIGGVWFNSFLGDLGHGQFDGANLVMNMEGLNPANTYWTKLYNLYSKVDTEAERFLKFEKWWGGFFMLTTREIHQIVDGLFIGNQLVRGTFELEEEKKIDLRKFNDPVVVFASRGDKITPPQQALNWIPMVYESVDEIKRHGQVIVYMVHPEIGHLGIFVSSAIAKKEQKEMIGSVEMINYLSPGLYEMVITEEPSQEWMNDYRVKFEERALDDIMAFDDGVADEVAFEHVAAVSEFNDNFYDTFLRPFVRSMATPLSAEIGKQLHPLRTQRYLISDLNPFMLPVKTMAPVIRENRHEIEPDNRFVNFERNMSEHITESWNIYRDARDRSRELMFKAIYNHPFTKMLFSETTEMAEYREGVERKQAETKKSAATDREKWKLAADKGGFTEGLIRIMIAMASVDGTIDAAELKVGGTILRGHEKFKYMEPEKLQTIVKEQSRILQTDREMALETLATLIPDQKDRKNVMDLAVKIAFADQVLEKDEKNLIHEIEEIFELI